MKKKKNHPLTTAVIGMIILLLLLLVFYFLQPKTNPKEKKEVEEPFEEISIEEDLVHKAYSFIPNYFCGGIYLKLDKTNKKIDDFSELERLNMVLSLYEEDILKTMSNQSTFELKEKELYQYFKDIRFMDSYKGIDTATRYDTGETEHKGTKKIEDVILPLYMLYEDGTYTIGGYGTGCTGPRNDGYYLELDRAEKNNKELVLSLIYYYSEAVYDDAKEDFVYRFYSEKGETIPVEEVNAKDMFEHEFTSTEYKEYEMRFEIGEEKLQLMSINYIG